MPIIVNGLPDSFNTDISESHAAIKTYANYNKAWCLRKSNEPTLREAQCSLDKFSNLQRRKNCDFSTVRQHLLRGNLTLKLVQDVPVNDNPDFAMISALWLPVQAYYAVHGFGLACLAAMSGTSGLPRTHAAFMRDAQQRIVRYLLPAPFSTVLGKGYSGFSHLQPEVLNMSNGWQDIRSGLNLAYPDESTRDAHIVQCLDTTRKRLIQSRLEVERTRARKPGKSRGILKGPRQREIANSVPSTTVLDYLYRTRVKSNYDDPTMYHEGSEDTATLIELVVNTQHLAVKLCALFVAILWKVLEKPLQVQLGEDIDIENLLRALE